MSNTYDVAWASPIVTRAWKSLRERFAAEGKLEWIDELRPFIAGGTAAPPNQEEVAKRLETSVETLRVWFTRLRQRDMRNASAEVASTVSNPAEIDAQLHYVYQILTSWRASLILVSKRLEFRETCGNTNHASPRPDSECLWFLVSFGFLAEDHEARGGGGNRVVPGLLHYAHFEVEIDDNTNPVKKSSSSTAVSLPHSRHNS